MPARISIRHSQRLLSSLIGFYIVTFSASGSADWPEATLSPSVLVTEKYTDNFNLSADSLSVWSTQYQAKLDSQIETEETKLDLNTRFIGEKFYQHSELNRDDVFVDTTLLHRFQAVEWRLSGNFSFDHPSSAELETDGNRAFNRIERTRWGVSPSVLWYLSRQMQLNTNYRYAETAYTDTGSQPRSDFQVHSASSQLTYQWSETTSLFTQLGYLKYIIPDAAASSQQFSLVGGVNHAFSDTLDVSMSAGGLVLLSKNEQAKASCAILDPSNNQCLQRETETTKQTESGYIVNASLRKQFESTLVTASFSHNLAPTINGGQIQRSDLSSKIDHKINQQLSLYISARAFENEGLKNNQSENGRLRYTGQIGFRWRFAEDWSLLSSYQYDHDKPDHRTAEDRNSVSVAIKYQWEPLQVFP